VRILVITSLYPSASEEVNLNNPKALHQIYNNWNSKRNVDLTILRTSFITSKFLGNLRNFKVDSFALNETKVIKFPIFKVPKFDIIYKKTIIKYVCENFGKSDIFIVHGMLNLIFGLKIKETLCIPLVTALHKTDLKKINKKPEKYLEIFEETELIACRSQMIMNEFIEIYPLFLHKTITIPSGIEREKIIPYQIAIDKIMKSRNDDSPVRFVTVSRLIPLKNIDINLRALSKLNIDWTYTVVGDGPQIQQLKKLTKDLCVEDKVFYMGQKSNDQVLQILKEQDVFIMVSEPETFGLSYLEAMACGCIIIGAIGNGIDGIVKDGFDGFLCEPRSVNSLHEKISYILSLSLNEIISVVKQSHETILNQVDEIVYAEYFNEIIKRKLVKD